MPSGSSGSVPTRAIGRNAPASARFSRARPSWRSCSSPPRPDGTASARERSGGIAGNRHSRGDVSRDDASGADDGAICDRYARQDDGAAANPDVTPDPHGSTEFETAPSDVRISRVVGRVDMHARADLTAIADDDADDVEKHAVEIDEDIVAEPDVVPVI